MSAGRTSPSVSLCHDARPIPRVLLLWDRCWGHRGHSGTPWHCPAHSAWELASGKDSSAAQQHFANRGNTSWSFFHFVPVASSVLPVLSVTLLSLGLCHCELCIYIFINRRDNVLTLSWALANDHNNVIQFHSTKHISVKVAQNEVVVWLYPNATFSPSH